MRILSIVGARPQFVKVAAVSAAAAGQPDLDHVIVHTGQHYDPEMSGSFFRDLAIPEPKYNLGIGSGQHGVQTGAMMQALDPVLEAERPDWVLVYGDTNSTLAAAVNAAKLHLPVAHVEAGLRSYNRRMPEELNRVVADHVSDLLLCPTEAAVRNLEKEGLGERAVMTGDVMYDAALLFRGRAGQHDGALAARYRQGEFALATIHRAENTDDPETLARILNALDEVARSICPVVFPAHPRTRKAMAALGWIPAAVQVVEPVGYLEMTLLEGRARLILTDSGGVQKEAYFARVPCITLRNETEWPETLAHGCNTLAGSDPARVLEACAAAPAAGPWDAVYGNGNAGALILAALAGAGVAHRAVGAPAVPA